MGLIDWLFGPSRSKDCPEKRIEREQRIDAAIQRAESRVEEQERIARKAVSDNPITKRLRARPVDYANDLDDTIKTILGGM